MVTDLLVVGLIAVLGALGWRSGTIKQVTHWAGIALGRAVAQPLALIVTLMLVKDFGFLPQTLRIGLSVFYFFAFYVIGFLIAGFFLRRFIAHRVHTRVDKAGGFVLALGKGAMMMFVFLSVLACFQRPLVAAFGRPPAIIGNSVIMTLVSRNNFFGGTPFGRLMRLARLMDAARDPKSAKALAGDPEFQAIMSDPRLRASLQDEDLARELRKGHWFALQKDPRIALLLDDPNVMGVLSDPLDWGDP